jgi:ribonucleoside-diphosphate reductase subunit M2
MSNLGTKIKEDTTTEQYNESIPVISELYKDVELKVTFTEPLLDKLNFRYTLKPIDTKYQILWDMYKKQQESYWTAEEIDFSKDYDDFLKLNDEEQHFIKLVLAFFAASDGIVNFNLRERFLTEIQVTEAQVAYGFQLQMESIHAEVYSDMLINIVRDVDERNYLFNAITKVESVKNMSEWAIKWIHSDKSFGHRIIAFAIVEGVFFSGAFASIFWLKKQRGSGKLFMEGLIKSNRFISRDEGMHVGFACALYTYVVEKVSKEEVYAMFEEANIISQQFINDAIPLKLLGMSNTSMNQYINYVSDRLLIMLGYDKLYNAFNPFDFMDTISLISKDNFFETRPDSYQKAHNQRNKDEWAFERLTKF